MERAYVIEVTEIRKKQVVVFVNPDQMGDSALAVARKLTNEGHINLDKTNPCDYDLRLRHRADDHDIIKSPCFDKYGPCH